LASLLPFHQVLFFLHTPPPLAKEFSSTFVHPFDHSLREQEHGHMVNCGTYETGINSCGSTSNT
jgi:hypothetical protein